MCIRDRHRFGDVVIACLPSAMDDVHHREGIPAADDTKEVLDTAIARRRVCGARLGASAGRNVAGSDIRWASRHARNVARGGSTRKRVGAAYLPRPDVLDTFPCPPVLAPLSALA